MINRRALIANAIASTVLCGAGAMAATPARSSNARRILNAADVHVDGYPTIMAEHWLGETLAAESGGELGLRIFHAGQLGRESDTLLLIRHGALAFTRVTTASVNNAVPATQVLSLPYVFDDVAHLRRALDGEAGRTILAQFEARGWIGLAFYDAGVRNVYNVRHPVKTPADMQGLKLRVPPSDLFMALLQSYGANPTPLPYGGVYTDLQTHLIDGAENNWPSFHASRQYEVARFLSLTEHAYTPDVLLMSAAIFYALSKAEQALIRDVALRSVTVMRAAWDVRVDAARTAAIAAGVQVNTVDHTAFRAAAAPFLQRYLADPETARLHAMIRAQSHKETL